MRCACTDVQMKHTHRWLVFKENINIPSYAHSNFIIWGFWLLFPQQICITSASAEMFGAAQLAGSLTIICLFCQSATVCRITSQTSNQLHVSAPASIGARIVVLPPALLLFSWQNSLSAELKAESVWHLDYIGASYQDGSMREECFWSTWPCTLSDD